jgi:hypothetical protein
MNKENINKENQVEATTEAQKKKQPLSVKNYRAFLINCLNFQSEQYKQWEEYEDKCHNLLRKSQSKSQSKALRVDLLRITQERKKIKSIIDNITTSLQSLNEYENLTGINYKLTPEFIATEKPKYFPEEKEDKEDTDEQ